MKYVRKRAIRVRMNQSHNKILCSPTVFCSFSKYQRLMDKTQLFYESGTISVVALYSAGWSKKRNAPHIGPGRQCDHRTICRRGWQCPMDWLAVVKGEVGAAERLRLIA